VHARATIEAPHILISTRTALNPKAHNEGRCSASSDSNPELIIDFSNDVHGKRHHRTSRNVRTRLYMYFYTD